MWPRGRPQSQQSQGPSGYAIGFNQYPQNNPQGVFRNHTSQNAQNFNRHRRDRARPRHQYSYYSDDSNSNYSNSSLHLRGGFSNASGMGRGSGIINAALSNIPTGPGPSTSRPQLKDKMNNYAQRNRNERSQSNNNQQINQPRENRSESRLSRDHHQEEMIQPTMYFCPECGENYNSRHTQARYAGKIPLILQCSHTMCQECIYQGLKNNKVTCPTCLEDSTLTQEQTPVCQSDMQNVFLPNFYILGIMGYYRSSGGHLRNLENMTFVSTRPKKAQVPSVPDPSDQCCFVTCSKEATVFCPSCEGIFCADCCTVVHKSTKKLMTHEPVPRRKQKFSLMLENCGEHPTMQVEFFCRTCDLTACCYCVLDKHTDHERVPLYHLNNAEMEEFKRQKKVAEKVLKEVLATQKKTTRLANFDTASVKKDVCQYFADCHAKLESLEKKLCDELEHFKANNRGLDNIQTSLMSSAEQLKQLVAFNEHKVGDRKLNLKGALDKLRNIDNIPRFLLNENGQSEPVRFVVNTAAFENIVDDFTIEKCEDSEYRLVTAKDLPEGYVINIDENDSEVNEAVNSIINKSIHSGDGLDSLSKTHGLFTMVSASAASSVNSRKTPKPTKPKEPKKKLDMERVDVQHVNSMDSFFIQYKNDQWRLGQLNKDIEDYVKMGGAQTVQQPQLNDLYLALYVNDSHTQSQKEQKWCRARLTEIKNGENGPVYEMFFIDYGRTQVVDANRIRDISTLLTQKRPFAIECMLHNPMGVNWNKTAHYALARTLNGKDVYMMERSNNNGIYEVDLMIASSDGGVTSVTDILVHAHHSVDPLNEDSVSLDGSLSRKDGYFPSGLKVFPNGKKFTKNQKERVTLATVVDPQNIFVHLVQHQDAFKSMTQAIKKAYKGGHKSVRASGCIPCEGTYVLVEYKDPIRSNWHRAFVKGVDLNSDKVHVLLVDWGLNVVVSAGSIRALEESFTKLESQAVLIKLVHIAPYDKQAIWSPYATNFLQTFFKSQDVLKMIVHNTEPELEVALFDISRNVDICLNAMMVENNLADSTGPVSTKLEWPQFETTNPEFSEDDGLMSSLLRRVDEQANDDSEEEDLSNVKKRQLDVVKFESPSLIWVKFLDFREKEADMFRQLQIYYSQTQNTKPTWTVGEQCVTEIGREFARGKILHLVGGQYKIYLWDKVQEVTAPTERIYEYDMYFAKYPQAVYRSHLANIKPAGGTGKWSSSSVEALQEIFSKHKRIYANKALENETESSKTASSKSLPLDMWYGVVIQGGPLDPDRMKYVSINNSLIRLGFAFKVPRPIIPKPSTSQAAIEADSSEAQATAKSAAETALMSLLSPLKKATTGEDLLKVAKSLIGSFQLQEPSEESAQNTPSLDIEKKTEETAETETTSNPQESNADEKITPKKVKDVTLDQGDPDIHAGGKDSKRPKKQWKKGKGDAAKQKHKEESKVVVELTEKEKQSSEKCDKDVENSDEKSKKSSEKPDDLKEEPVTNWNAIVEQELGGPNEDNNDTSVNDESEGSPYHKSEVAIDDWLSPFRLAKKDFKARVTCVETGGHMYLHDEAMDDVYYKMEANIKEYFDSNPPEITDHQWQPGQLCTIKFTDGKWYRGKILKTKDPDEISVFMIDFGSDHDLTPDVLFREVLYTDIQAFATKAKLDKVYARSGSWLTSDYDHFHDLVTDWCRIIVKGPLDVELPLVEVYNEKGVLINQKLVELCPNLSRCSNFPIQGGEEDEDDNVVIECIESEDARADELLMESVNRELDVRRIPLKEIGLPGANLEDLKYKVRPLPQELLEGKEVLMEVGGVMNFNTITFRMPADDVSEEMYDLVMEIQDIVDSLPILTDFTVGMPCLAPYSEDGIWYRARISGNSAAELGVVNVIFIDYGNVEDVPTKNVKAIKLDFMNLPQQSWEATLNVALEEDAELITVMQLMNTLERKRRHVKLVQENPLIVDLYQKDGHLCYDSLISNGALKPLLKDKVESSQIDPI